VATVSADDSLALGVSTGDAVGMAQPSSAPRGRRKYPALQH
jgi:hypothetical protein